MSRAAAPMIGVIFDDRHPYFRGMHLGIARYARQHTDWTIFVTPVWDPALDLQASRRNICGLIGVARRLRELEPQVPGVNRVSITYRGDDGLRTVIPDHARVGTKVAAHLLERGLTAFGSFMDGNPDLRSAPTMHAETQAA